MARSASTSRSNRRRLRTRARREEASGVGRAGKLGVSAPPREPDVTVALGVDVDAPYDAEVHDVAAASSTTKCLAPVAKVLHETVGIRRRDDDRHAYTADERLTDAAHEDSVARALRPREADGAPPITARGAR